MGVLGSISRDGPLAQLLICDADIPDATVGFMVFPNELPVPDLMFRHRTRHPHPSSYCIFGQKKRPN